MHGDHCALHADDLGNVGDFARAVLHARQMNDEIDARSDLFADCLHRQLYRHQHHILDARQRVARCVGMDSRHRPVVASVHGL